jgi:hypothetical protein
MAAGVKTLSLLFAPVRALSYERVNTSVFMSSPPQNVFLLAPITGPEFMNCPELLRAEIFALSSENYNADNESTSVRFVEARLAGTIRSAPVHGISRKTGRDLQYVTFLVN